MKIASIALILLGCLSILQAAPSGMPVAPMGDANRAFEAIDRVAQSGFIEGNWGLKLLLWRRNDEGRKFFKPMVMLGGQGHLRGPWQRVMFQDDRQYLIEQGKVWDLTSKVALVMDAMALDNSIAEEVPVSWEEFAMLFLRWPAHDYDGIERLRGRYCDVVVVAEEEAPMRKAKIWLDVEFGVPMQVELIDSQDRPYKRIRAVSLQKSNERWILRRWQFQDLRSDAKVDIEVVATALGQPWPEEFDDKKPGVWPENIQWSELE